MIFIARLHRKSKSIPKSIFSDRVDAFGLPVWPGKGFLDDRAASVMHLVGFGATLGSKEGSTGFDWLICWPFWMSWDPREWSKLVRENLSSPFDSFGGSFQARCGHFAGFRTTFELVCICFQIWTVTYLAGLRPVRRARGCCTGSAFLLHVSGIGGGRSRSSVRCAGEIAGNVMFSVLGLGASYGS